MSPAAGPRVYRYSRPGTSWFEIDDSRDEVRLSAAQRAFAAGLRARAYRWGLPPADTWIQVWGDAEDGPGLLAGLSGVGLRRAGLGGVFAAELVDAHLHCGPVHANLTHFLRPWSAALEFDADGPPEQLADHAARWMESLQRRPVALYVWFHRQTVYAGRYEFADTGDLLGERYDPDFAPPDEPDAMIAAGHLVGLGDISTAGLAVPDAFVFIRGERTAARVPAGLRELPPSVLPSILRGDGGWLGCDARHG